MDNYYSKRIKEIKRPNTIADINDADIKPLSVKLGRIASALEVMSGVSVRPAEDRVISLNQSVSLAGATAVHVVGIPPYVDENNISDYSEYGINEYGWYLFAKLNAPEDILVTAETAISGADGYVKTVGDSFVKVAVRFDVVAASKAVTVNWGDGVTDKYVFTATDLAIRNLDYRTTFYIYDMTPYVTWEYSAATGTFAEDKNYYTKNGDEYTLATVTVGETIPEGEYYVHSKLIFSGMTRNISYCFEETVDCPIEIVCPEIEADGHGAWLEIQTYFDAQYSCVLTLPEDVKPGTTHTQDMKKGINTIDLHYIAVKDKKTWQLINTHTDI